MVAAKAGLEQAGSSKFAQRQSELLAGGFSFSGYERDGLYLNLGDKTFENISGISGIDSLSDGRGAVFADFDNDGDHDIFLTTIQGPAHLMFRNNVGQDQAFIRVSLEGRKSGRDAFGAQIKVKTTQGIQSKIKSGGGGFNSQADPRLIFGLGKDSKAEWLEVRWPSGELQKFTGIPAGSSLKIVEGSPFVNEQMKAFSLPEPISEEEGRLASLKIRQGDTFPNIALTALKEGAASNMYQLLQPGETYLVNFWATWCTPCTREMPQLQKLHTTEASRLRVIGLSLDLTSERRNVTRFLNRHNIDYPNYLCAENTVSKIFNTEEIFIPLSFLLDAEGRVIEIFPGWSPKTQKRLQTLLD